MAFFGNLFSTPKQAFGLGLELLGVSSAQSSARREANLFRNQASQVRALQSFNEELADLETERRTEQLSRDLSLTLGRQQVQTAVSGLETTSKSFLQLRNESLSQFSRAILQERSDNELNKRVSRFQAESEAFQLEARARSTESGARMSLLSSAFNIGSQISDIASLNSEA